MSVMLDETEDLTVCVDWEDFDCPNSSLSFPRIEPGGDLMDPLGSCLSLCMGANDSNSKSSSMSSSSLYGCAKHSTLADEDEEEDMGVSGGGSMFRIADGSSLADTGEIKKSSSSAEVGDRKVIGDGVCSEGVGGRFDRGGGVREGGTGRRRELDVCLRITLPGAEFEEPEMVRASDVDENEVITVGEGRPPIEALDPFGEPAETLDALGRNAFIPVAATWVCAPGEIRADEGGLKSFPS